MRRYILPALLVAALALAAPAAAQSYYVESAVAYVLGAVANGSAVYLLPPGAYYVKLPVAPCVAATAKLLESNTTGVTVVPVNATHALVVAGSPARAVIACGAATPVVSDGLLRLDLQLPAAYTLYLNSSYVLLTPAVPVGSSGAFQVYTVEGPTSITYLYVPPTPPVTPTPSPTPTPTPNVTTTNATTTSAPAPRPVSPAGRLAVAALVIMLLQAVLAWVLAQLAAGR